MALIDLAGGEADLRNSEPAIILEPDATPEQLAEAAASSGPIALRFPKFNDGRGISLARLLRDRHGYTGEIRAIGHLIPDLAQFLLRTGVDTAEIADDALGEWQAALKRVTHLYQPSFRNPYLMRREASAREAEALNTKLAATDTLADRIRLIRSSVEGRIAFSTSLQREDQAILHAIYEAGADFDVFTLDTGRLFQETLETVEASEERYGIRIRLVVPEREEVEALTQQDGSLGFRRSVENRIRCCDIRKVRPLSRALDGAQGWITGIRRDQTETRDEVPFAVWDVERGLMKFNPIADWSTEQLDAYLTAHNVPVHPLHAQGFPSIGCMTCTRAVQPGEHPRAGRWWWENEEKKECGLHMNPNRTGKAA